MALGAVDFFGERVDGRSNIVRYRRRITDQSGLSARLVHGRKVRYTDAVAKNQQCHVHWKNNAERAGRIRAENIRCLRGRA